MFLKSLSKKEKESLLCFKEIYLLKRGQIEKYNRKLIRSELSKEMEKRFPNFSPQLTEDLVDCALNFSNDVAICDTIGDVSCFRKKLFLRIYCPTSYYVNIYHFIRCSVN